MIHPKFFTPVTENRLTMERLMRVSALVALISTGASVANAAPFAYEGFNYSSGSALAGQTGPLGFSLPFTASSTGLSVSSGGSAYGDLSVSGNKLSFAGNTNNGNYGSLSQSPETPGTSVYFSYLMQASPTGGYAGVSLFNGADEVLFTGKRNGGIYLFGMEPKAGAAANSSIACTRLSLVVCRIDFAADSAVIRMYVNPQTAVEPATADLTVTRTVALTYDRVRFQSSDVTGSVDEFRMGNTFADVAPMTYGSIPSEIVVLGSSVAAGTGASPNDTGWAWRMKTSLETPPPVVPGSRVAWNVHNASIGGNNTTAVINRFQNDVAAPRVGANVVLISLSLANEGLVGSTNPQAVFDSFKSGLEEIISRCRTANMRPVVALCYPQNLYNAEQYAYVRKMNLLINSWDVPSVNFLGAIDNGSGQWASGFFADDGHPNSQGHLEMQGSVVPSLFDAIVAGKTTKPEWNGTTGYLRLQQNPASPSPLSYTPAQEYRSLTLSFRVRTTTTGSVAAITSGGTGASLEIRSNALVHVSPTGSETSIPTTLTDGRWHDLALSYRKPTNQTLIFVDGQLQATVAGSLTASTFNVGGPGSITGRAAAPVQADYQDVAIYRAAWTQDEALAQSRGALQQASLDILATLDDSNPLQGMPLVNRAQSFSSLNLQTGSFTARAASTTPSNLSAVSYANGAASLSWTDNTSGNAIFTIERRRTGVSEPWVTIGTSPAGKAFFADSGLLSGTSYDYRVSTAEGSLQGDFTKVASVTPAGQSVTSYDTWVAGFYPPPQDEAVYQVDFNSSVTPNYNGARWNTVSNPSISAPLALFDSEGNTAGVTVAVSNAFDQTRNDALPANATPPVTPLTGYPTVAQSSLFALRDDSPLTGAITFAGLDPAAVYDFSFFARRGALVANFDYSGTYTFTGGGTPVSVVVDGATNMMMTNVPGISPTASGTITLTVTAGPGTGTDFPVINFLKFQKGRPGTHLVDFNASASPSYGLVNWNTVNSASSFTPYTLRDMYGVNRGVGLTLTDGFDQTRTDGGSPLAEYPVTAQSNLFALRDNPPLTAAMTFTGLNPALAYDFSFFSRRGSLVANFDYTGTFTFTGAGAPVTVVADAAVGTALTKVPPVTPDATGKITLSISAGPASGTDFPVLNFIRFSPPVEAPNRVAMIDRNADPDGDGRSNFEEYARGFNPKVADGSPLKMKAFTVDSNAVSRLQITRQRSASEADYILESSSDLTTWSQDTTATRSVIAFDGTNETLLFEAPSSGPKRFFRLVLKKQP